MTDKDKETATAIGFGALLTLVLGPVGIVIAALAVGTERAWNRRNGGRPAAGNRAGRKGGAGWRDTVARQEDWLAGDWEQRRQYRAAHRDWWKSGADPAKRPTPPKGGIGRWLRRALARVVIFAGGARDGAAAAAQARREGASLREIATARPPADAPEKATAAPAAAAVDTTTTDAYITEDPAITDEVNPQPVPADEASTQPATPDNPQQEEPVTAPTATAAAQPQAETNLDMTVADLGEINAELTRIAETTDQLAQQKASLEAHIARANERAAATGATSATRVALDSAAGVAVELGQHLGNFSQAAIEAGDNTDAAQHGLAPAQDAQDTLHGAGATGEFVSAAVDG